MSLSRRSLAAIALAGVPLVAAQNRNTEPYAVVEGTVFQESGFSLSGAEVKLVPKDNPKAKPMRAVSDARGEFAFRVPARPGSYIVSASMKNFEPDQKEAVVNGEERINVTLSLLRRSK
jgi:hypothetical protein